MQAHTLGGVNDVDNGPAHADTTLVEDTASDLREPLRLGTGRRGVEVPSRHEHGRGGIQHRHADRHHHSERRPHLISHRAPELGDALQTVYCGDEHWQRRLEKRGFVSSRLGEATPERGGRPKRFSKLEAAGMEQLRASRRALIRMWDGHEGALAPASEEV